MVHVCIIVVMNRFSKCQFLLRGYHLLQLKDNGV